MIHAVFFDLGGTIHIVNHSPKREEWFSAQVLQCLKNEGIDLSVSSHELMEIIRKNDPVYKHWAETNLRELPSAKVWNEYYLKDFQIGEKRLDPIAEELSVMYDRDRVENVLRPHVIETLQELKSMGMVLGVISNIISQSFVPNMLHSYGIDSYFASITCSEETGIRKPDPEIFEIAARRAQISLCEMAYVGDTLSRDVLGSRNAHLPLVIQINNPSTKFRDEGLIGTGLKPDFLIEDFNEIPDLIRAFNQKASEE